ncbi:MAG: SWIM zinc finger family protein [Phycisphaerales bacterium]
MEHWDLERVLALAPDSDSAAAGQALASARKWSGLGRSDRAIWGLCQGSGKNPYQTRVDLTEPAFKCSCPSRKFPCKHGLGLFMLYAKDAGELKAQAEPDWVSEWLAGRANRVDKKAEREKAGAEQLVDLEAASKRVSQRESRVMEGIAGCRVWLDDLVRRGLAAAQSESAADWERAAARMVDAQAPGLAGMVRRIPEAIASGEGWDARTLDLMGRIHLLLCAAQRLDSLPADLGGDVRTALGWAQSKEDAMAGEAVPDRWAAMGQIVEDEDRLRVCRTWLVGRKTGRRALLLDFAAGGQSLQLSAAAGTEFEGELAFYPGRAPLRAMVKSRGDAWALSAPLGAAADRSAIAGLAKYGEALGANPWVVRWPLVVAGARPAPEGDRWFLVDEGGHALPVKPSFADGLQMWRLISASGGAPLTVVAEWDGEWALPVAAIGADAFHDLAPRWAA